MNMNICDVLVQIVLSKDRFEPAGSRLCSLFIVCGPVVREAGLVTERSPNRFRGLAKMWEELVTIRGTEPPAAPPVPL